MRRVLPVAFLIVSYILGLYGSSVWFSLLFVLYLWFRSLQGPLIRNSLNVNPRIPESLHFQDQLREEDAGEDGSWLNIIIAKMWIRFHDDICSWFVSTLQPTLDFYLPSWLQYAHLHSLSLSQLGPSLRNHKVYRDRDPNVLFWEADLVLVDVAFYVSLKVKKAHVSHQVYVRNARISGRLQMQLTFVDRYPWCGRVRIAFVSHPTVFLDIQFLRLALMEIPFVADFLTDYLNTQAFAWMTQGGDPGFLDIPLEEWYTTPDAVATKPHSQSGVSKKSKRPSIKKTLSVRLQEVKEAEGILSLKICEATGLRAEVSSDIYCVIVVEKERLESSIEEDEHQAMVWNEWFDFVVSSRFSAVCEVAIYDKKFIGDDECLGITHVPLSVFREGVDYHGRLQVHAKATGKKVGHLLVQVRFDEFPETGRGSVGSRATIRRPSGGHQGSSSVDVTVTKAEARDFGLYPCHSDPSNACAGVLQVAVLSASSLVGSRTTNPYVRVSARNTVRQDESWRARVLDSGARRLVPIDPLDEAAALTNRRSAAWLQTGVQSKTLDPAWNEYVEVAVTDPVHTVVRFEVFDRDFFGEDALLGELELTLKAVGDVSPATLTLPLRPTTSGFLSLDIAFDAQTHTALQTLNVRSTNSILATSALGSSRSESRDSTGLGFSSLVKRIISSKDSGSDAPDVSLAERAETLLSDFIAKARKRGKDGSVSSMCSSSRTNLSTKVRVKRTAAGATEGSAGSLTRSGRSRGPWCQSEEKSEEHMRRLRFHRIALEEKLAFGEPVNIQIGVIYEAAVAIGVAEDDWIPFLQQCYQRAVAAAKDGKDPSSVIRSAGLAAASRNDPACSPASSTVTSQPASLQGSPMSPAAVNQPFTADFSAATSNPTLNVATAAGTPLSQEQGTTVPVPVLPGEGGRLGVEAKEEPRVSRQSMHVQPILAARQKLRKWSERGRDKTKQ